MIPDSLVSSMSASAYGGASFNSALEMVLDQFEATWQAGAMPDITAALASSAAEGESRQSLLRELVLLDLNYRWKQAGSSPGESTATTHETGASPALPLRPRLDDYARLYPELGAPETWPARMLAHEFRARLSADRSVTKGEYFDCFPAQSDELHSLLQDVGPNLATTLQPECGSSVASPERRLLFALLAYQSDIISRSQLLAAFGAWCGDKTKSLDDWLVAQGALIEEDRLALLRMVDRHVARAGGDPIQSLAQLSSISTLRQELESLAKDDATAQHTLAYVCAKPTDGKDSHANQTRSKGSESSPRFKIVRPHAKGGLGEVSVAHDTELNREVALKEIQSRYSDDLASRSRFMVEAEITGGLEHPGIVPVYGLGQYADGRPYYAMRFIRGDSLQEAITQFHDAAHGASAAPFGSVEFRKLLGRFIDVCEAIEYAHSRGVLHRDLKPGNIMLGKYGETLVVDWGLAKAVGKSDQFATSGEATLVPLSGSAVERTQMGAAMGTPAYMSPEQAAGRLDQLGPATDIYSLGATLFHVLTGQSPFINRPLPELLACVQRGNFRRPRELNSHVPKSLEAVCLKAMAARPEDRYLTAKEIAEEIERWLADEPVTAHPETPLAKAARWIRTHRAWAMSGVVAMALVAVVSSVAAVWINSARAKVVTAQRSEAKQLKIALRNEKVAITAQKKAEAAALAEEKAKVEEAQQRQLANAAAIAEKQQRLLAEKEEKRANDEADRGRHHLYAAHMNLAQLAWDRARVDETERISDLYRPRLGEETSSDLRGFEWFFWDRLCRSDLVALNGHTGWVTNLAFSVDGKWLVSASDDRTCKVWNTISGQELLTLKGHTGPVWGVAFSSNTRLLASASADQSVKLWDIGRGQDSHTLRGHTGEVFSVAFGPDGKRLASASKDGTVKVWDAVSGREMLTLRGHAGPILSVAFSADGKRLASGGGDRIVRVWDAMSGQDLLTLKGHTRVILSVAYSPDGMRLASAAGDQTVRVWDAASGQELLTMKEHTGVVRTVAFSADGKQLASAGEDRTVRVWDATTGQPALTIEGHTGTVMSLAFSPDGKRLASGSFDQKVKIWDAILGQEPVTLKGHTAGATCVVFSADGKLLASASDDQTVKMWDTENGQEIFTLKGHAAGATCVAFSANGKLLASASKDGTVKVWDTTSGQETLTLKGHLNQVTSVAFCQDRERLISAGIDQTLKMWNSKSGQEILTLKGHTGIVWSVAIIPGGKRMASAGGFGDQAVKIWDTESGEEIFTLKGHTSIVRSVAFSVDGKWLVSASQDQMLKVWDAERGQEALTLQGHTGPVTCAVFSPDGKRLASASGDQSVKVWDAASGQELLALKGHVKEVTGVAFSPDGNRLASCSRDGTVKIWDARPWTPALRAEREALSLIHFLRGRGKPQSEWPVAIASDQTISEPVRQRALQFARDWK